MLFDTPSPMGGGSGQKFDWTLLKDYDAPIPYMLSGGIGPDDVDRVVEAVRPGMVGIDINSRFETEPGVKDISLLAKFILSLRQFNEDESIRTPFL
jgi:phosphoribosylanthranilate isomerase